MKRRSSKISPRSPKDMPFTLLSSRNTNDEIRETNDVLFRAASRFTRYASRFTLMENAACLCVARRQAGGPFEGLRACFFSILLNPAIVMLFMEDRGRSKRKNDIRGFTIWETSVRAYGGHPVAVMPVKTRIQEEEEGLDSHFVGMRAEGVVSQYPVLMVRTKSQLPFLG